MSAISLSMVCSLYLTDRTLQIFAALRAFHNFHFIVLANAKVNIDSVFGRVVVTPRQTTTKTNAGNGTGHLWSPPMQLDTPHTAGANFWVTRK